MQAKETKAIARNIRIAPRKVRLVVDEVRGKDVGTALSLLTNINRSAKMPIEKVIKSAYANAAYVNEVIADGGEGAEKMTARYGAEFALDKLFIKEIYVNEGPTLKRFRPRAQGRAFEILKRTSNITVVLAER